MGRKNEKFRLEIEKMSEIFPPPKPIKHYLEVGRKIFSYIDDNFKSVTQDVLRYNFISFLNTICEGSKSDEVTAEGS